MSYLTFARAILGAVFILCLQLAPAQAQQRFTYVSRSSGSDANSCFTPTVACLTLQRAHNQTIAGGTAFVLDSGAPASEQLIITKAISFVAVGATHYAVDGGNSPIIINAGPDDVVLLDGIRVKSFPGYSPDVYGGIRFVGGRRLHIRNCVVEGFDQGYGVHIIGPGPSTVEISDCVISNNRHGLFVRPVGSASIVVLLDRVTVAGNIRDGIRAQNQKALVRINASTIADNQTGLNPLNGGKVVSFGNNIIRDNGTNGAPTNTISLQ